MSQQQPSEVSVEELAARVSDGAFVLDVREPQEYTAGHVPGAAHMPLHTVPARYEELPRDQTGYVVCASGGRSAQAAQFLAAAGFSAGNVDGGTKGWLGGSRCRGRWRAGLSRPPHGNESCTRGLNRGTSTGRSHDVSHRVPG